MDIPLLERSVDALVIENPVDLLYLTGVSLSKGLLVLKKEEACLFVDGRYLEAAKQSAPCRVEPSEGDGWVLFLAGKVGFDSGFVSYDGYQRLLKKAPQVEWIPISSPLKEMRICKNPKEIEALRRAAALTLAGYQHVHSLLKEGVSEEELAFAFEFFCRKKGATGLSFEPIIAFGENSACPHHRAGPTRLQKNQLVLIDVGAIVDGYRGDMTRVDFFGAVDPALSRLFTIVKTAQEMAIAAVRPGVKAGDLDRLVRDYFRREGVEELFTHSLGHGIGLETHESPRLKYKGEDGDIVLRPSMVFTIEPGLYQPGLGGVRYEDMILVTETGGEKLC